MPVERRTRRLTIRQRVAAMVHALRLARPADAELIAICDASDAAGGAMLLSVEWAWRALPEQPGLPAWRWQLRRRGWHGDRTVEEGVGLATGAARFNEVIEEESTS